MKSTHFIGIGGIGMSALAKILLMQKIPVSGSDIASSYVTEELKSLGAKVHIGHDARNVPQDAIVVYSTDITKDNPEFLFAIKNHMEVMHRSDLLQKMMKGKKTIAIAGTHGKTTTTSLMATVFTECGMHPTFAVGGVVKNYGTNALWGPGEHFIAEADESDGTFLKYTPFGAIVTNIGMDHMNYFGTKERLKEAFLKFLFKVQSHEHLFFCKDNKYLNEICHHGVGYGFSEDSALRGSNFRQEGWKLSLDIRFQGRLYNKVEAPLIGFHNALNVLSVFGYAVASGIREETVRAALLKFEGVKRRSDVIAKKEGIVFVDDYAHHPTEIASTLSGLKAVFQGNRFVIVYQPHRYSRVKDCKGSFGKIFDDADELIVTDIYSAGETPVQGVEAMNIVEEVLDESDVSTAFIPKEKLHEHLKRFLKKGDAVVFMGAGDISSFGRQFTAQYQASPLLAESVSIC